MESFNCTNPDCNVAETGKCVEGFEIGKCPHQKAEAPDLDINRADIPNEELESLAAAEQGEEDKTPQTSTGELLDIDQATTVLCGGPGRVICLIGPRDSGKTTLGISLYDAFQNGPYDRWSFSGSNTLLAFDKRWHYARVSCGRAKPDTPRTSLSEGLGFLNIAVHSTETQRLDLLISDRSGEFYERIADNLEDCENLFEVKRANSLLFLIDGERLVSDERYGIKNEIVLFLKTLLENGVISESQRIALVLTKYDLVISSDKIKQAEALFDAILQIFQNNCSFLVSEIKTFKIAARPENNVLDMRYGLLELFDEFVKFTPRRFSKSSKIVFSSRFFNSLH